MTPSSIKIIKATWIFDRSGYAYEAVLQTLVANDYMGTLRFVLKEVDGEDSDLEIVIQRIDANHYYFKTDYYGDPTEELALKPFRSEDEMLLYYDGRHGVAYFHLIFGE